MALAFNLSLSANIAAAAATATTQQLTSPPTGTFGAGRISDDTNPLPSLDLTTDQYTEVEWSIKANATGIIPGQVYEFRVTKGGVVLDTYSQTPEWTVLAGPTNFALSASANIAAAAATATTQQLTTAPAGTFFAGRISDDTNPLPSLNLGNDQYTEIEWAIRAIQIRVIAGEIYEFRGTRGGVPLET